MKVSACREALKGNFKLSRQTIHFSVEEPQSQRRRLAQGHTARLEGGTETVPVLGLPFFCPSTLAAQVKDTNDSQGHIKFGEI